eukprot:scaffold15594_cov63-Phaeocystis_antarctica.AAC.3
MAGMELERFLGDGPGETGGAILLRAASHAALSGRLGACASCMALTTSSTVACSRLRESPVLSCTEIVFGMVVERR